MGKPPNHKNDGVSNIKLLCSECPRSSSYQFFIRKSIQNEAQNGASIAQKLHPKLHQQSTRKMSTSGLQNGAQIWNKTCPEITSKLYQNLVSKMSPSWLQKWSVWSERSRVSWPFARARSSQMDCDTSRPQGSRPIRSSPLEPIAFRTSNRIVFNTKKEAPWSSK